MLRRTPLHCPLQHPRPSQGYPSLPLCSPSPFPPLYPSLPPPPSGHPPPDPCLPLRHLPLLCLPLKIIQGRTESRLLAHWCEDLPHVAFPHDQSRTWPFRREHRAEGICYHETGRIRETGGEPGRRARGILRHRECHSKQV